MLRFEGNKNHEEYEPYSRDNNEKGKSVSGLEIKWQKLSNEERSDVLYLHLLSSFFLSHPGVFFFPIRVS